MLNTGCMLDFFYSENRGTRFLRMVCTNLTHNLYYR